MNIYLIAAMDKNRVIGKDNDLPWSLPNDLKYVNKKTVGNTILLGRRNFESIGRVLPKRRNIVLTRDKDFNVDGCDVVHSVEEALSVFGKDETIFIFGGEQIYKLFMPYVTRMYITKIDHEFDGDTFFPEFNLEEWKEVYFEEGNVDEKNMYNHSFHVYERTEV